MESSFEDSPTLTDGQVFKHNYHDDISPFSKFLQATLASAMSTEEEIPVFYFKDFSFHLVRPQNGRCIVQLCGLDDIWTLPDVPILIVGKKSYQSYMESTTISESLDEESTPKESTIQQINCYSKTTVWAGQVLSSDLVYLHSSFPFRPLEDIKNISYVDHSMISAIHVNEARYVSSMVNICMQKILKSKPSAKSLKIPALLFKCNSSKPEYVSWLFSHLNLGSNSKGMTCLKKSFIVNNLGPTMSIYRTLYEKLECGDKVEIFRKSSLDSLRTYSSHYNVHSSELFGDSTVTVDFCWQGFSKPCSPPPPGSNAVIKFKACPRNPMSAAKTIFQEVIKLHAFCDAIESGIWPVDKTTDNFDVKVSEFIKYLDTEKEVKEVEKMDQDSSHLDAPDSPLYELILSEYSRKDIDFTDDLWSFLKDLGSYEQVKSALRQVFMAIFYGSLQPVLSSTNKTKIAQFLRDFYQHIGVNQDLKLYNDQLNDIVGHPEKLLSVITEMGIQKLTSDYLVYFQKMEVATQLQLERVIGNATTYENRLNGIMKLHYALEIMLLAKLHFRLTDDLLRTLSKSVFDYYTIHNPEKSTPYFALAVPSYAASATTVHKKCIDLDPLSWKCCIPLKHKITGCDDKLIFVFSGTAQNQSFSMLNGSNADHSQVEDPLEYNLIYAQSSSLRIF